MYTLVNYSISCFTCNYGTMMLWWKGNLKMAWSDITSIITPIYNHFRCIFCQLKKHKKMTFQGVFNYHILTSIPNVGEFALVFQNVSYLFSVAPPVDSWSRSAACSFTYECCILSWFWVFWYNRYLNICRGKLNSKFSCCNVWWFVTVLNCNIGSFTPQVCSIVSLIRN